MCEQELQYWDWLAKVTERLTFARLKVNDRKDISEEDYALLKVLFPIWYRGEYPLYKTIMEGTSQTVTQSSLFDAITTDTVQLDPNGTDVEISFTETNNEEK